MKPIILKRDSPREVIATPTEMMATMFTSMKEDFSRPNRNDKNNTATGVKALSIYQRTVFKEG